MTGPAVSSGDLSPVKRALLEIRRLKKQLAEERRLRAEPIAIVGVGLRFPGEPAGLDGFWDQLTSGFDAITDVPLDRWDHGALYDPDPEARGRYYVQHGGFVRDVYDFEPEFFGIAPREALSMDPQQRVLLETAWTAFEDAGIPPGGLRGSRTGVFVGIANGDYGKLVLSRRDTIDEYAVAGTLFSVAAGRLSYILGLQGPAIAVDTACSSSLVAVHLACQSLRSRESDLVVAGGVNLILLPEVTINFCRARMLAADGRCKTFDDAADGYVRSEGCAVVILKRLSDARRDRDRILALIRGSAVNQDGRSSGLTAPNGLAQEDVIRGALQNAGLHPDEIAYLEAHGTGTALGDPIELRALGRVFGDGARRQPLLVGSVKTNLGHLEATAGIAGLLKATLVVSRGEVPPHLHLTEPTRHLDWDALPLRVPTKRVTLASDEPLRAGVSSFGFSGTNAHVIVEAYAGDEALEASAERDAQETESTRPIAPDRPLHVLTLSAPTRDGLERVARAMARHLARTSADFRAICATANAGRTHMAHRLAIVAGDAGSARAQLEAWAGASDAQPVAYADALSLPPPATAFLFTELNATSSLRLVVEAYPRAMGVLQAGLSAAGAATLADLSTTATSLVMQCAAAELWRGFGLDPDRVVGIGTGELAASVFQGRLSLAHALATLETRDPVGAAPGVSNTVAGAAVPAAKADDALRTLLADDPHLHVISIGGSSMLADRVRTIADGATLEWVELAPESGDPWRDLMRGLARIHVSGAPVQWRAVDGRHEPVTLPSFPFARRPFRFDAGPADAVFPAEHRQAGYTDERVAASADIDTVGQRAEHVPDAVAAADGAGDTGFLPQFEEAVGSEREELVTQVVRACVMEVLRAPRDRPPSREARLMDLGVDSLMAVRLRNLLQKKLGLKQELPATLVFDHPTITRMSALVLTLVANQGLQAATSDADGTRDAGVMTDGSEPADRGSTSRREAELAALSDEEAEALLQERLATWERR